MPDIFGLRLLNHSISDIAGIGTINLSASPLQGWSRVIKFAEDRIIGLCLAILALPLLTAIAAAILLKIGRPILFRQARTGWDERPINVYKFRTMRTHDQDGWVCQATRTDPRVTPLGAFLRRTSLDELPQLFNVLNGTMSLVGPRPHALEHNEYFKDEVDQYMKRHRVKPGITGWAQVNGLRGETDTVDKMQRRVEYDLFYIEHWSITFDLRILIKTVRTVLHRTNAY